MGRLFVVLGIFAGPRFTAGVALMKLLPATFLAAAIFALLTWRADAGDAVMWNPTARHFVAEYSGTPEGGKDYLTEDQAQESVEKLMLKQKAVNPVAVWKSDRTGYFAVWTGVTAANVTVAAVGFGTTETAAKLKGLEEIRKAGAKTQLFIAYRYSSYGHDYVPTAPPLDDMTASPVENEEIGSLSPDGRFALCTSHSRGWKLRRFDVIDLQTFKILLEVGMPTTLFGSVVWSADAQRFAFFGEERAFGDTSVYFLEDGKYVPVALPERDKFPDPEFNLAPDERNLKTTNDSVRPNGWSKTGDLELEHKVEIVVEKNFKQVATAEATATMTIQFDAGRNATITSVAQTTTRKAKEVKEVKPAPKGALPISSPEPAKKAGK